MPHPAEPTDIAVGTELDPLERTVGFENWNRYAAVNDEFVPIHMDDDAGRAAGYPTAFGMGNLHVAFLHVLLDRWLDGRGEVRSLEVQFRRPSVRGIANIARATVTAVDRLDHETLVTLDVRVVDGDDTVLTPGTATVSLPH